MTLAPLTLLVIIVASFALGFVLGGRGKGSGSAAAVSQSGTDAIPAPVAAQLKAMGVPPELLKGTPVVTRVNWQVNGAPVPLPSAVSANTPGLDDLHRRDPSFDDQAFLQRATMIYSVLGQAQAFGNPGSLAGMVSQRFMAGWAALGPIDPPSTGDTAMKIQIQSARQDPSGDTVIVRLDFVPAGWQPGTPVSPLSSAYLSFVRAGNVPGAGGWVLDQVSPQPGATAAAAA